MNIFKVADEKAIPSWFVEEEDQDKSAPIEEVESINIAEEVDDTVLVEECDRIEACSSNGKIYHYNSNWAANTVRHLREYAIACGMDLDKFKGFDPSNLKKEAQAEPMIKTAQASPEATALINVMGDPFHIEERSDTSHMEPANWESIKKQENLTDAPMSMGDVIAIRGGENYFLNSDVNPAANQNSITNPNAIGELAESSVDDTGVRLRKEQEAKEAQKEANHAEWQQEKIAEMSQGDIIPKGTVFPTETLNAHTGLNRPSSQSGVYGTFDPTSIPEKTAGEQIAEKNEERKASIQRPKVEDNWEKPCKQNSRSISDSFGNSLAELLKK